MDPLEPIAGVSLERYAELAAKMAGCSDDPEACAQLAALEGVPRGTWVEAAAGWNARFADPATASTVAAAYAPAYQAALARFGGPPATATLDEYLAMLAMIQTDLTGPEARPVPHEAMYERFGIDLPRWSQISTYWVEQLRRDPHLGREFDRRLRIQIRELDRRWLASLEVSA